MMIPEKELDVFELELAIKWAHAAALMDANPEVSYLFALSETALKEKLERLKTIQPPNDPLTPEKLREMDGEPVKVVCCKDCKHLYFKDFSAFCPHKVSACRPDGFCEYGERRKPEERTT